MGRPRSFEEAELLESVMREFWRHGYAATTYRGLEAVSGVGVRSLANVFGDKDELFVKALARYRLMVTDNITALFEEPGVDGIIRVFARVSSPTDFNNPRSAGCLMVNTGFEIDQPGEQIASELTEYRHLWRSTFLEALQADDVLNADARSEFLVGALWGALSQIRLANDTTAAEPMASVVIETVRGWTNRN